MTVLLAGLISLVSLAVGGITIWIFARPGVRRVRASAEAILGEEPVLDRSGNLIQPGRPGLVHLQRENSARLTTVEEAIVEFRHLTGIVTEFQGTLARLEHRVTSLEDNRVKDIVNAAERAATAATSAEMLRLVNERDTVDSTATEPAGDIEP